MKINRGELVTRIANESGLTKGNTDIFIDAFVEVVSKALENDESVFMLNFGTFELKKKKERIGTNPRTGEKMPIPAHNLPYFKPGSTLKDRVNAEGF